MWVLILIMTFNGEPGKPKKEVCRIEPFYSESACLEALKKFKEYNEVIKDSKVYPVCIEKR